MGDERKDRVVKYTSQFKSDLKRAGSHKKCDPASLKRVMKEIESRGTLAAKLLDHPLRGRYPDQKGAHTDCRECHVCNDWLLVYRFPDDNTVLFVRTGTHSDLF
jgi:mRNA interferase YafQ